MKLWQNCFSLESVPHLHLHWKNKFGLWHINSLIFWNLIKLRKNKIKMASYIIDWFQ